MIMPYSVIMLDNKRNCQSISTLYFVTENNQVLEADRFVILIVTANTEIKTDWFDNHPVA